MTEEWKEEKLIEYLELTNEDCTETEWKIIKNIFGLKSNDAVLRIPKGTILKIFDYE